MLTVVGLSTYRGGGRGSRHWICRCDCGQESVIVAGGSLKKGVSKSCGCLRKKLTAKKFRTHGRSSSRTYSIWHGMIRRCDDPRRQEYKNYGGRGITVCESWYSFNQFLADMGEAPKGMSIDRINNDSGYSKDNCRWADKKTQANNTRKNHLITIDGVTKNIRQWEVDRGFAPGTISWRIYEGWDAERAVTTPINRQRKAGI